MLRTRAEGGAVELAPPHLIDSAAERAAPSSPELGRTSAEAFSVEDAFRLCALAPYETVRQAAAQTDPTSVAGLMLAATVRQCEGDVPRAEAALERAAQRAGGQDLAYVLDLLVPLLISRELFDAASAALNRVPVPDDPSVLALRVVLDAHRERGVAPSARARHVRELLEETDDEVVRLRVHQRLALAAYYRGDAGGALEDVAEGVRLARLLDAHRAAAALHSVAYATHQTCTGDVEATWRHARQLADQARKGGDASYRAIGDVALYALAAERDDAPVLAEARAAIDAHPLPEQYRERFAAGIADALRLGWADEFAACRNVLIVLRDMRDRSEGERALCRAMLALVSAALEDDDGARRFARQAVSDSARPERRLVAHELRYRRLARALAAVASELVGDIVRGRRAAQARFLQGDSDVAWLAGLAAGDAIWSSAPTSIRGFARFVYRACERYALRPTSGPLTATEIAILKLIDVGNNAPQIAVLLDRSPHTVRTHLRNAHAKLEARGRLDALTRARRLGLL
ncbi:MAG: LuxR family transcriptional regulator, maltose regulon positive regulatory protein [Candidatus Eremiobacteraeota bacterium]|jgi:DNA-binding CsgD family transcriptional regulator|nr:LuxR family transcriptional regulator, maltose regulon positive regulatory protein [Candidatus Eremiobacteraeota bacterium]